MPFLDPTNQVDWVLNTEVSDEFAADQIDEERWYIVVKFEDGKPVYKHPNLPNKKVWKGRDPGFLFNEEIRVPVFGDALPHENITTVCFISRKLF